MARSTPVIPHQTARGQRLPAAAASAPSHATAAGSSRAWPGARRPQQQAATAQLDLMPIASSQQRPPTGGAAIASPACRLAAAKQGWRWRPSSWRQQALAAAQQQHKGRRCPLKQRDTPLCSSCVRQQGRADVRIFFSRQAAFCPPLRLQTQVDGDPASPRAPARPLPGLPAAAHHRADQCAAAPAARRPTHEGQQQGLALDTPPPAAAPAPDPRPRRIAASNTSLPRRRSPGAPRRAGAQSIDAAEPRNPSFAHAAPQQAKRPCPAHPPGAPKRTGAWSCTSRRPFPPRRPARRSPAAPPPGAR